MTNVISQFLTISSRCLRVLVRRIRGPDSHVMTFLYWENPSPHFSTLAHSTPVLRKFLFYLSILFFCGCDEYPKDPQHALHTIQQRKVIRIGVIEHAPWAYREDGLAKGIEISIVSDFARSIGVEPQWHFVSEAEATALLKQHELDVVVGGLTRASPRKEEIGFTRSYFNNGESQEHQHVLAVPNGENRLVVRLEKFLNEHQKTIQKYYEAEHL